MVGGEMEGAMLQTFLLLFFFFPFLQLLSSFVFLFVIIKKQPNETTITLI